MGVKNITNIHRCTATYIIDYFDDIIGNDLEKIIYKLYNTKLKNEDKAYIDAAIENLKLTDLNELKRARKHKEIYTGTNRKQENICKSKSI